MSFRQVFKLPSKLPIRWFPGHMNKGLKQMSQKLKMVDCVIEVHDARISLSGRNPEFQQQITGGQLKPHILVLNKSDLIEEREKRTIERELKRRDKLQHIVWTNCKNQQCSGVSRLKNLSQELIAKSERYNRSMEKDLCVLIIGVPNVGKSSLVNVMRNKNLRMRSASAVGGVAGITRSVLEKIKICENPTIYMIDTPGILEPKIDNDEIGMKLALVGCLPDHLVGPDLIADYLLYWLNKHEYFDYVSIMGLKQASDHIVEVLVEIANKMGATRKHKNYDGQILNVPDIYAAARIFINAFRTGELGRFNLDREIKKKTEFKAKLLEEANVQ